MGSNQSTEEIVDQVFDTMEYGGSSNVQLLRTKGSFITDQLNVQQSIIMTTLNELYAADGNGNQGTSNLNSTCRRVSDLLEQQYGGIWNAIIMECLPNGSGGLKCSAMDLIVFRVSNQYAVMVFRTGTPPIFCGNYSPPGQ